MILNTDCSQPFLKHPSKVEVATPRLSGKHDHTNCCYKSFISSTQKDPKSDFWIPLRFQEELRYDMPGPPGLDLVLTAHGLIAWPKMGKTWIFLM